MAPLNTRVSRDRRGPSNGRSVAAAAVLALGRHKAGRQSLRYKRLLLALSFDGETVDMILGGGARELQSAAD